MQQFYTDEQRAFEQEVRSWVQATLDPHVRTKMLSSGRVNFAEHVAWWQALNAKGWAAPAFPIEYGGTGWDVMQRNIFIDALSEEGAPPQNVWALQMIGPVLIEFGTEAQKAEFLPRMLSVQDFWAQGFSEPGSGSDLASLKTRAEDKGDHWLVNGQKLWTTYAQHANKIFVLCRTDANVKPQAGITMLLLDMDMPGIEVRPVITLDREHEVNEVFFDDVRVPKGNIVGVPGQGWTIAKFLLSNERAGIAQVGKLKRLLSRLKGIVTQTPSGDGGTLAETRHFRDEIALIESDLMGVELSNLRMLMAEKVYAQASILKLRSSEIEQRLNELAMEAGGPVSLPFDDDARNLEADYAHLGPDFAASLAPEYFRSRAASVYGGTSEVQHNIIAKSVLGL